MASNTYVVLYSPLNPIHCPDEIKHVYITASFHVSANHHSAPLNSRMFCCAHSRHTQTLPHVKWPLILCIRGLCIIDLWMGSEITHQLREKGILSSGWSVLNSILR